jgi:dihydroorotase-like cyclic amidohydrolase
MNEVNISIPASLEHLKAKAGAFKEGGLTITVIASLKLLLFDHDSFSEAVLAKVDPGIGEEKTREGEAAVKNIHDSIQAGIVFFEGDLV